MLGKIIKKNAGVFILFMSIMLMVPNLTAINLQYERKNMNIIPDETTDVGDLDITKIIDNMRYVPIEDVSFAGEQNDIGYNIDAGDNIYRGLDIYVGEPVNERVPGNGRTGTLEPSDGDGEDWYRFTACAGQNIQASVSSSQGFNSVIHDTDGQPVGSSFTATETGRHYFRVYTEGQNDGDYTMSISISGQNDAETGSDAGDNIGSATSISPGSYFGYMDSQDVEDWYSFNVGNNQGIFVTVDPMEKSDYDIHLYNPSGILVHSSQFYGTDELEYPADVPGTWTIRLDIFPGWDASIWPDDYFLYGSGAYELEITVGGDAEAPPTLRPQQREVVPVAQTFVVNDEPTSTSDEYSYLAAVPAAVYMENGERHVSPIVYQGVDIIPNWFTTIDQATQYLLDDWNAYLDRHGMTADVIELDDNPIKAAADIATTKWTSSNTAVIAVDGSGFTDETNEILNKNVNLNCQKEVTSYQADELQEGGEDSYQIPLLIGAKYAAVHLFAEGEFNGDTFIMTPRYESIGGDWWPYESGTPGIDKDSFFPVSKPGLWVPQVSGIDGLDQLKVVKYTGDRHKLSVTDSDTSLKVTITTEEDSHLVIFLIDPEGNIRRPRLPHWNGGEIKPIYQWNGGHWEHDEDQYRHWIVEPHKEFTVEVNYPMKGTWTAIVVPYIDINTWEASFDGTYHITASIRKHNPDRVSAGLSAANAAVLASQKHVPLLYVTEDSVPSETSNAITQLGVTNIFFVNINDVSSASPPGSVTEYTTLKDIVSAIKANTDSENVITITSFATGDGYFAPSAMIAASHGSPVLSIGEAKDAYNTNDMFIAFLDWDGDYYHGCRSIGDIPMMDEPINIRNPPKLLDLILYYITHDQTLPPVGLDLKLQWASTIYNDIHSMIDGYDLDNEGQEAYIFVSPRDTDIRDSINRILLGNNSYSGQIMVETTAFSATVIARNVLYPAIIYANPGRDVVSSQHMNYYAGRFEHDANDGNSYLVDAPVFNKNSYSSWGRFYEGHTLWENLLERYNTGSSLNFYSGHGTGGSGISAQYKNMAEQFPLGTTTHESLYDFEWWDSWAGYSGYDNSKTITVRDRDNSLYNSEEPSLYNFIHFKWVDQLFENLHSEIDIWSSCTTAAHFGPIVYLSHGTVVYAGCTGSGYTLVDDFYKSLILRDFLIKGWTLGEAFSLNNWIVNRDYTTLDPTSIYGEGTFFAAGIHSVNVIFGDPTIQCYNPTWIEPVPISS